MREKRFTLTELAVVVVIGVMLATLLVPAVTRLAARRDLADCQRNLQELGMATADFVERHDGYLPMANGPSGWWYEQMPADQSLYCNANPGSGKTMDAVNYGWNSYLGDNELSEVSTAVRRAAIDRPESILTAGDGTHTGEFREVNGGTAVVWLQKTWNREAQQQVSGPRIHGDGLNYLFVDGHVRTVSLADPRLTANPALLPEHNFWVERVVSAPGPFFE